MKNVAVLTEDGAFVLFFRPHPRGFDSSRVMPGVCRGGGGGGGGGWGGGGGGGVLGGVGVGCSWSLELTDA